MKIFNSYKTKETKFYVFIMQQACKHLNKKLF